MSSLEVEALVENLDTVFDFLHQELKQYGVGMHMKVDVAVEEIFVNIASYAYDPETGPAKITVEEAEDPKRIVIRFEDRGKPYNPLVREEMDIAEHNRERKVGGLGIYMAKRNMDNLYYEYEDGWNVVTMEKLLKEDEEPEKEEK
jgi:anti-sigma regulatory factor (Ser/Thr protein kinase)